MAKIPPIMPISDLRRDAASALQQVRESRLPLIITQRGRAAAVMLSIEAYEKTEHDRELLLLLARGDQEVTVGDGHSLDSVMAEADQLLEGLQ